MLTRIAIEHFRTNWLITKLEAIKNECVKKYGLDYKKTLCCEENK